MGPTKILCNHIAQASHRREHFLAGTNEQVASNHAMFLSAAGGHATNFTQVRIAAGSTLFWQEPMKPRYPRCPRSCRPFPDDQVYTDAPIKRVVGNFLTGSRWQR